MDSAARVRCLCIFLILAPASPLAVGLADPKAFRPVCTPGACRTRGCRIHGSEWKGWTVNARAQTRPALPIRLKGGIEEGRDSGNATEEPGSIGAAMLLIAGTTVGGGFLALPYVVAPAGFLPSALSLFAIWLFFIAQSFVVVELLSDTAMARGRKGVGMTAVAGSALGRFGEVAVTVLIVVLTKATLVSQISKAGSILAPHLSLHASFGVYPAGEYAMSVSVVQKLLHLLRIAF